MIKYFSAFSGIGGFEIGIERTFYNQKTRGRRQEKIISKQGSRNIGSESDVGQYPACIGYSEIDKYAIQIYKKHFKGHKNYGDITKIDTGTLPDFDLFVGGFPCQSFSIAGKRKGFEDTRGTLFFEIARILKDKRPRYFVLENVKGLLSHDEGNTFKVIISILDELGYFVEWQVLNSKNFGVPQNRERVFIIGHLGGECRPKVFPIGENDRIFNETIKTERPSTQTEISTTVRVAGGTKADSTFILSRSHGFNKGGKRTKPNLRYSSIQNELVGGIRRLTPVECERLQGFPDNWTDCVSDTQRYKTLGNAVTVNVIEFIIWKLFKSK